MSQEGHGHVVQLLLEAGADPGLRDSDGDNALGAAVRGKAKDDDGVDGDALVNALISAGAYAGNSNWSGLTPLHYAANFSRPAWVHMLCDAGAGAWPIPKVRTIN